MAITDSSIFRNLFTDVRARLVTALDGTGVSVNAVFNDKALTRPQVVLSPAVMTEDNFPFNDTEGTKAITMVVDIWAGTAKDMDTYSDTIITAIKANDIDGISLESVEVSYDFTQSQEDKLHLKTLSCGYVRE